MTVVTSVLEQLRSAYLGYRDFHFRTRTDRAGNFYDADDEADVAEMDELLARAQWALDVVNIRRKALEHVRLTLSRSMRDDRGDCTHIPSLKSALELINAALEQGATSAAVKVDLPPSTA